MQERVNDAHWSLAMALAWITYRTEQAVINIKGDTGWAPTEAAIRDLLSALRSGKLIAHGMFEGERIPRPIETAVWSTFEIVIESMMFVGHMFLPTSGTPVVIAQRMGPPQTQLLSPTVPAGVAPVVQMKSVRRHESVERDAFLLAPATHDREARE